MIEFLDALLRHFRRHKMKYMLGLLATATVTAGVLYASGSETRRIETRADKIKRSNADC